MVSNTAVALLSAGCLLTMPALAFAQDDLMARARQQFEPIPTAAPELPGNAATPAQRSNSGRCSTSIRDCPRAISSAATHATISGLAVPTHNPPRLGIAGSMAAEMHPRCSMQNSTRPSSGMVGPRTSSSKRWADGQSGGDGLARSPCR